MLAAQIRVDARTRLRMLAAEEGRSIKSLVGEALEILFAKHDRAKAVRP